MLTLSDEDVDPLIVNLLVSLFSESVDRASSSHPRSILW